MSLSTTRWSSFRENAASKHRSQATPIKLLRGCGDNYSGRGFKIYRDRHGKQRCYHRETGIPVDLKKIVLGSAYFLAECARIAALAEAKAAAAQDKPGTLGLLICDYRNSSSFQDLAPRTKIDYKKYSIICGRSPMSPWRSLIARLSCAFATRRHKQRPPFRKLCQGCAFHCLYVGLRARAPRNQSGLAHKGIAPSKRRAGSKPALERPRARYGPR